MDQWKKLYERKFVHWLFHLPGVSILCVELDELHILQLGIVQYMLGSVLHLLCFEVLDESAEDNVQRVWSELATSYKYFGAETHPDD